MWQGEDNSSVNLLTIEMEKVRRQGSAVLRSIELCSHIVSGLFPKQSVLRGIQYAN
jgi:hypothetical protein